MDRLQIIANELRGELNTMWNGIAKLLASQVKYLDPQLAHDSRSRSLYGRYARIRHSIRVEMPECANDLPCRNYKEPDDFSDSLQRAELCALDRDIQSLLSVLNRHPL